MSISSLGPRTGITLFSLTMEWLSRQYTLDQLVERCAELKLGPGLEIVGFQSIRGFPQVSDEFAASFKKLLERTSLEPSCLAINVDLALRRDRLLTEDETVEYVAVQVRAAQKLGFPVARVQMTASPAVLRKLAPLAEKTKIKLGMELHSPYAVDNPLVLEFRRLFDELDSPYLGFIPDYGVSMHRIPPGILASFQQDGVSETLIALVKEVWAMNAPPPQKFEQLKARGTALGGTPPQLGRLNMLLNMFGRQAPERWAEIAPRVVHVHGKFYGFDEKGDESSIDYGAIVKVLRDGGYNGFISSEYEGHAFVDTESGFDMVQKHQALLRRHGVRS